MLVYISGPITGTEDYISRFCEVEMRLREAGHTVVNPAKVSEALPAGQSHDFYMAVDLALLARCDAICMMHGWLASEGAQQEYNAARLQGLAFIDVDTGEEIESEEAINANDTH